MMSDNKIKLLVIIIVVMITTSMLFYYLTKNDHHVEYIPPSFTGDLEPTKIDLDNNTLKLKVNVTFCDDDLPPLERNQLFMRMRIFYQNGSISRYFIKRYSKTVNKSDQFSFAYIDQNEDGLISTDDFVDVDIYIDLTTVDGFRFYLGHADYRSALTSSFINITSY